MNYPEIRTRLVEIFGPANFSDDAGLLNTYGNSMSGTFVQPLAIVFPETRESILSLFQFANESKLALYPIARGKNFGYGDAQGTAGGQVIVDLSRMNKILEINEEQCYAVIEPGVSQVQMYRYLEEKNSRLQLDVTGAGLDASICGNMLERGFGHTNYGNRFARIINMVVVTPAGQVIQTGFRGFEKSDAKNTYRYGFGPVLDGLFTQSNFGIVVELTFELMPRPERSDLFVFTTKKYSDIGNIVAVIRELKLAGVVNSAVHIANKGRAVGDKKNSLAGVWNLSGSINGSAQLVRARRREIKRQFRKNFSGYRLLFISKKIMQFLGWVQRNVYATNAFDSLRDVYELALGVPTDEPLKTLMNDESITSETIGKKPYPNGFLWVNAVCKADGKSVLKLLGLLEELFRRNNYEFRVTFTAVNPNTLILISNISFPKDPASIEKADAFFEACKKAMYANGFYPYRSGSGTYQHLPGFDAQYSDLLQGMKKLFDPGNILAPGKYNI